MWDLFCRVIDNHGDLGVCLRLARQLARRGVGVRLWVDEPAALAWMAPDVWAGSDTRIEVRPWSSAVDPEVLARLNPSRVWIEAFGCEIPEPFVLHGVRQAQSGGVTPKWINLEYLSAEGFVERAHGLPSPVMTGPAQGWVKHFFYPGFTSRTGGLLREPELRSLQDGFDRGAHRMALCPDLPSGGRLISLFCYEPPGLPQLLQAWRPSDRLLVTPGRALNAVRSVTPLALFGLPQPYTDQAGFDRMLWACDLNLVRGEDSLVRALWAGRPLVWQIYPQEDQAHHAKLLAFLDVLDAPPSLRRFHAVWNGLESGPLPTWSTGTLADWGECVSATRQRLWGQPDLVTQLLDFVSPPA